MTDKTIYIVIFLIYGVALAPDFWKIFSLIRNSSLEIDLNKYLRRVYIVVFICATILTFVLINFQVNLLNYSKPIQYSDLEKISLKNFNGFKLPGQKLQGSEQFAFITTSISVKRDKENLDITSYFHPARSYVYIDNLEDKNLLAHELNHFHITELCARKFRQEVLNLGKIPDKRKLDKLYKKFKALESDMQSEYDYGTNHGYLLGKQLKWEKETQDQLSELIKFVNPSINFQTK